MVSKRPNIRLLFYRVERNQDKRVKTDMIHGRPFKNY